MTADGRLIKPGSGSERDQVIGQVEAGQVVGQGQVIIQNGQENLRPTTDLCLNDSEDSSVAD